MRLINVCLVLLIVIFGCTQKSETVNNEPDSGNINLTTYVDPYIGTGFHGHVFLGANVPFGAVQLGPVNITQGWDWCSGYHYSDSTLIGFSQTHLSGTGIGDLGDILFMPVSGDVNIRRGDLENPGYMAFYTHDQERVKPGYYAVEIDKYGVTAELTASQRVGFHKYTFTSDEDPHVIIDLERGIGWDAPVEAHLEWSNDSTIVGYRFSKGWAEDQRIFFAAVFSEPIQEFTAFDADQPVEGKVVKGKLVKGAVSFDQNGSKTILSKVGISPVSTENALLNISSEIPDWNFDRVVENADQAWNKELNKIKVKTKDEADMRVFYTSLYHTIIAPSIFNDVNGEYRGTDKKIHQDTTFTNLTTFSLWDTYRAANPLFTIFQPERVNDMVNSMLKIYEQQGKLPVWHLMGNETNTMVGYSAVPVIVDAYLKGFDGFDPILAYEAVKNTAMLDERGIHFVKDQGFIPADSTVESVAMGLEYAISDWCVAQMAKSMGKEEDYQYFSQRGKNYQNYFDQDVRFMRGRLSENKWRTPFDPLKSQHRNDDFCEGNSWQYTWLVPQDVEGLMEMHGGEELFIVKLDSLFEVEGDMGESASNDITGLIGQYAHGNEPSHHITYLYAYAGQPWKTAEKVSYILNELYTDQPDGLCGNEDVGQMSAWYVLSALGFYPVNPANGIFVFGSPKIDEATLSFGNGKVLRIDVENRSPENIYIQSVELNGSVYDKSFIHYKNLKKGGSLKITMSSTPDPEWGVSMESRPYSELK